MSAKKKKANSKSISNQKRSSRRMLTFYRVCRYGLDSFIRNSWLSVAATAVMVITLLIIFVAAAVHTVMVDTVGSLRDKVNMSIYLKTDTPDDQGSALVAEVKKVQSVRTAEYISSADAREQMAKENSGSTDVLAALKEATNKTPATIRVTVENINDTSKLEDFVDNNSLLKKYLSTDYKPSFAGERRDIIKSIGRAVGFAQKVGIAASSVFVVISSLIIFNTIRMAIFNRREEIQMMQLIGADKGFIRGPFLVEAVIYGVIAAFLAAGIGIFSLYKASPILESYQINVQPTLDFAANYSAIVILGMVAIGAIIGVISSTLATRRYLKL